MLSKIARSLAEFVHHQRGNVAILFGLSLIPIAIGVGVAVDYGRAILVRERMADALDAAALAIGSWTDLTQSQLNAKAQQFFNANYPSTMLGNLNPVQVNVDGDNITVSVTGTVPTTFMQLADISTMDISASSTVTRKQQSIEVVLVLDTTGSMSQRLGGSQTKINALKSAATQMVETLFEGNATSDTLKIGVVPFAAAVNVGADKLSSGWIDTAAYTTSNASTHKVLFEDLDAVTSNNGVSPLKIYTGNSFTDTNHFAFGSTHPWAGCVRERGGPSDNPTYALTDAPPSTTTPASLWAPYFAPDEPDTNNGYSNDYLSDGSYSSTTCVTSSSNSDNKRQCFTGKYKGAKGVSVGSGPDYNCPPAADKITALTSTKSTVETAISALQANGNTVLPAGLLWGWRVISPGVPFTEGADYSDTKWVKAIVLLTDGENDVSEGSNGYDKSTYNAFGYAKNGHLGSTSGSNADATLDTYTTTVCNNIKNANPSNPIQIYTIGLGVTSASQSLLQGCATKPDMFYNAPNSDQLAGIFSDIAQGLSDLRIAQ